MSTNDHSTEPLTDAELDALARLDAARTPGLWRVRDYTRFSEMICAETDKSIAIGVPPNDARAIAAALNALPALLAEVRASRAAAVEGAAK